MNMYHSANNIKLGGGQTTRLCIVCVYVFLNTVNDGAKQKLTKSIPRRHSIRAVYTREENPMQNFGTKEGGACLLKGGVFLGTYSTIITIIDYYQILLLPLGV